MTEESIQTEDPAVESNNFGSRSQMNERITIELPEETKAALDEAVREEGVSPNNFVAKALKDYLFIRRFRNLRERLLSETTETLTDQDVFDRVS